MELTYLGHSAFRLKGKDVTILTDPHPPEIGSPMGKPSADIVTVSHASPNHSYIQGVSGDPRIVAGPGEYELANVLIAGIATSMEPKVGPTNTAYVFRVDDLIVCHLGDLRNSLTDSQVEELGNIDVLLVPVGGGKAAGAAQASAIISQLAPSLVVPMHFRTHDSPVEELETVEPFCKEVGLKEYTAEPKLVLTKSSLTHEMRIVVLEYRRV